MSNLYYRIVAESGRVATLQDFDESDYAPGTFLTDSSGVPLKFDSPGDAEQHYAGQVRELAEAMQMIGKAWGTLQIPAEARFLAHKMINHFNVIIPTEKSN